MSTQEFLFPTFEYHIDESDPDLIVLRRQDDSFVAAFSARGATTEGIILAAREDYQELVRVYLARREKAAPEVEREEIRAETQRREDLSRGCA